MANGYFDATGLFGESPEAMQRRLFDESQARRQKEIEWLAGQTTSPVETYYGLQSLEPLRQQYANLGDDPRVKQLREQAQAAQQAMQGFEFKTAEDFANAASKFMGLGMPDLAGKFLKMAEARRKATTTEFDDNTTKQVYSNVFNTTGIDLSKSNAELGITQEKRQELYNKGLGVVKDLKRAGVGEQFDVADVKDLSNYVQKTMQPKTAAANNVLPAIGFLERLNESSDSGWGARLSLYADKLKQTFGFTDEETDAKIANREAFESQAMQQVLNFVQQTKGSISNKEMNLFSDASVGLTRSKAGNKLILKIAKNMAKLQQKLQQHYSTWRNKPENKGKGYSAWQDEEINFLNIESAKMFDAEDIALMEQARDIQVAAPVAPQAAPQGTPAAADVGTINAPQPVTSYEEGLQVMPKGSYFITPEGDIYLVD